MAKVTLIIVMLFVTCHCKIEFSDRPRNFSVELLYFTAEETQWHTVISPFGVWSLLTAASLGATSSSSAQLVETLILPKNKKTLIIGYKSLAQSVLESDTPDVVLKSRNFLFADNNFLLKKEFVDMIKKYFVTTVNKLSFTQSEKAQEIANDVIQKFRITNSNVFTANDFKNSKMILANIISFKGLWQSPFNVTKTKVESFYDENGKEVGKVNMMLQEGYFPYSDIHEIQASALELPYGDKETSRYSFLVLLPYANEKTQNVYNALDTMTVKDIIDNLNINTDNNKTVRVAVSLPRFKISTNVILNKPLHKMGLINIFDQNNASFKLVTDTDIFVSAVVHKADIELTEAGTITSATMPIFQQNRLLPSSFNANRPFIYFVIEKTTSTIIFGGIYSRPSLF